MRLKSTYGVVSLVEALQCLGVLSCVFYADSRRCLLLFVESYSLPCNCPDEYHPVCAVSGRTYPNSCLARLVQSSFSETCRPWQSSSVISQLFSRHRRGKISCMEILPRYNHPRSLNRPTFLSIAPKASLSAEIGRSNNKLYPYSHGCADRFSANDSTN